MPVIGDGGLGEGQNTKSVILRENFKNKSVLHNVCFSFNSSRKVFSLQMVMKDRCTGGDASNVVLRRNSGWNNERVVSCSSFHEVNNHFRRGLIQFVACQLRTFALVNSLITRLLRPSVKNVVGVFVFVLRFVYGS